MILKLRWVGVYTLNLLAATLGVFFATGLLLNVVLYPFLPLINRAKLLSVAQGPYYVLPICLALITGYVSHTRFKGNHRFWVWVVPLLYFLFELARWKLSASVLGTWESAIAHFIACSPDCHPVEDVTLPLYTSIAYSLGALSEQQSIFRFPQSKEQRRS